MEDKRVWLAEFRRYAQIVLNVNGAIAGGGARIDFLEACGG
jgi:hypothetical protein